MTKIPFETTPDQRKQLFSIVNKMIDSNIDPLFCLEALALADTDQGVFDLMLCWLNSDVQEEKEFALDDIEKSIDDYAASVTAEKQYFCHWCKKPAEWGHNYCSWECHVEEAKADGGKIIAPNGLPIACIRADGTMLEHEHGDHPDYIFPVDAEYRGPIEDVTERYGEVYYTNDKEFHALIYTDDSVALTLYECTYYMWFLNHYGKSSHSKHWFLTDSSVNKINKYYEDSHGKKE